MPELPEVEMYARYFARHALGQRIARVRVLDPRILGTRKIKQLVGRSFDEVRRHGKNLFVRVILSRDDGEGSPTSSQGIPRSARDDTSSQGIPRSARDDTPWLHIHFGMTGDLAYYSGQTPDPRFARVVFDFESGSHLAYEDARLFGVVDVVPSPDDFIRDRGLGPDPLDPAFRLRDFRRLLHKRRGRIKALLMSQEVIAGIGNLYADEALFRACIDPRRPVDRLTDDEVKALFHAIRRVLQETIDRKARNIDHPGRLLIQHREEGDRCPRCGGTIRSAVVAGRTTYYCSKHQR